MNLRIDLLKPSERRYQGPVSGKFIGFMTVLFVFASVILIVSYMIFTGLLQKRQLAWAKESWDVMEPRHRSLLKTRNTKEQIDRLQNELESWHSNRIAWRSLLDEIRSTVPANIQLTSLSMEDKLNEREDSLEEGKRSEAYRQMKMGVRGKSHGANSESAVIGFIADLRKIGGTNTVFETVTLNSMQKERAGENVRSFVVSCAGRERYLK